jgi:hypothetical protein
MKGKKMLEIFTEKNMDSEWLTPQVKEAIEQSYRRGYFHGASHCYDYSTTRTRAKIVEWINEKVQSWYYSGNKSKKELPPAP